MMRLLFSFALALFASTPLFAQNDERPKVLLIGDSISMGYEPYVTKALKEKADIRKLPENGAHTRNGLAKIDKWLGNTQWAVIHFNWGLHDLVEGGTAVPIEEYKANMEKLMSRLEKTGAVLVFANTTPVPKVNARKRSDDDVVRYNQAAEEIARKHGIRVNDLYGTAKASLPEWQNRDDVHFNAAGSEGLGRKVAESIRDALKKDAK